MNKGDIMKKIFIYYSLSNNGDVVSEEFKKKGYDIRKVITKRKYPKSMFFRILVGGYKASFNKKDKLLDFDSDISDPIIMIRYNSSNVLLFNSILISTFSSNSTASFCSI